MIAYMVELRGIDHVTNRIAAMWGTAALSAKRTLARDAANDRFEPKAGTAEGHLASYVSSIPYLIALVVTDSITFGGASQAVQQSI